MNLGNILDLLLFSPFNLRGYEWLASSTCDF